MGGVQDTALHLSLCNFALATGYWMLATLRPMASGRADKCCPRFYLRPKNVKWQGLTPICESALSFFHLIFYSYRRAYYFYLSEVVDEAVYNLSLLLGCLDALFAV